jgi:hypothetical protein
MRQEVERKIARAFIREAIKQGYAINIDNGAGDTENGYELPEPSRDAAAILKAMFATDDERLYLFKAGAAEPCGWCWFVYGNDGWDVITDYTTNLEPLMGPANKLSEKYGD